MNLTDEEKELLKQGKLEKLKDVKNKNFFSSAKHAVDGIICAFKTERNLRIDYVMGLFVLLFSLFFDFTKTEFACLCLTIGFVIFSEMVNSTVEYVVDLVTDKYDERAKAAKDIAAGGVFISAVVAVVVAYFLFADKIYNATNNILTTVLDSKLYLFFTIVFAVVILAIILKGFFSKEDEKYNKNFPSVRVTLAFAITTYAFIVTKSILVCITSFILSLIISQMRVENEKIRVPYIIFSALLGVLMVLIVYQLVLYKPEINQILHTIF